MKTGWICLSVACVLAVAGPALAGTTADARAAGDGVVVTIDNAVVGNTTDLINSLAVKSVHIQDAFGGITLFGGNDEIDGLLVSEGESITITGETSSFNGLFELETPFPDPFIIVNNGFVGLVTPAVITLTDMEDGSLTAEGFESTLVRLNNVVFQNAGGVFAGSSNETVENILMTSTGTVRISTTELSIVGLTIPSGPVDIIGVFSQFDGGGPGPGVPGNGYQLQPRSILDIITPGSPPVSAAVTAIVPLNTASQDLTLTVADVNGDPFVVKVLTVPTTGTIFDGNVEIGTLANPVPYTMSDPPVVTFFPAADDGTDMVITYLGEQTTNGLSGPEAPASVQVQNDTVVITEVMYNPRGIITESQWEWVEIYNTSTTDTFTLSELQSDTCPDSICGNDLVNGVGANLVIGPGEIKVIVGVPSDFFGGTPRDEQEFFDKWGLTASQVFFPNAQFPFLSNGGNQLFLRDVSGDLVDFVTNYGTADFPPDTDGLSISLNDPVLDNDDGLNWSLAVISCSLGSKQVFDGSVGSPGVVPTLAGPPVASSAFTPCADTGDLNLMQVGSPGDTVKTFTLTGVLGPGAPAGATVAFKITKLPFVITNSGRTELFDATLHDGPLATDPVLGVDSVVTNAGGQVTLVDTGGVRHFISFEFKVVEDLGARAFGLESNAATPTVAVQDKTVVITEIMADPANTSGGSETYWEFIEVKNTGPDPVVLGSLQGDFGTSFNTRNVGGSLAQPFPNATIPANATRIFARDDQDTATVRTQAEFVAEWAAAGVTASNVVYVPNTAMDDLWNAVQNNPSAPGWFITLWDNSNTGEFDGLLDVVIYQNGQNGWPANAEPNSIFYRGDGVGGVGTTGPFTTLGNDTPGNWQQSALGCAGDGSIASATGGADVTADHGSPSTLPTNPNQCVPTACDCPGDIDGDTFLTGKDIQGFIDIVLAPGFPADGCADMNGDGNGLDYLPDVPLFVDALVFGSTDCLDFEITHTTDITISLIGDPEDGEIELLIGGCDPTLACDTLATPPTICFERVTVTPETTAVQLAEELAFGLDGGTPTKDGVGGLDEFCLAQGADVSVTGSTISIVFTRAAGQPVPCCYVQDTDGRFSTAGSFDFVLLGGANNCTVSNLLNGAMGDEGAGHTGGFRFTKTGE